MVLLTAHANNRTIMDSQTSTALNTPMHSSRDLGASSSSRAAATPSSAQESAGGRLGVVSEDQVVVWDSTLQQMVVKDRADVKLQVCCAQRGCAAFASSKKIPNCGTPFPCADHNLRSRQAHNRD